MNQSTELAPAQQIEAEIWKRQIASIHLQEEIGRLDTSGLSSEAKSYLWHATTLYQQSLNDDLRQWEAGMRRAIEILEAQS